MESLQLRTPVRLNGSLFMSKSAIRKVCSATLRKYRPGSTVDERDSRFLADLIQWHPDATAKIGVGIERFEVRHNEGTPTNGFYLVRVDGTGTDFSFNECISPSTHRTKVLGALRHAVIRQVTDVLNEAFDPGTPVRCAITDVLLPTRQDAHVDHEDPLFIDLATAFVDERGGWNAIEIHDGEGIVGSRLADDALRVEWETYHYARARLRVVSIGANLSRGAARSGR